MNIHLQMFHLPHLIIIFLCLLCPIFFSRYLKKEHLTYYLCFFCLLELSRLFYLFFFEQFDIKTDLSLQLCFLMGLFAPIARKNKLFLDYISIYAIPFGAFAVLVNDTSIYPVTSFSFIQGYLYHSFMILLGTFLMRSNDRIKYRNLTFLLLLAQLGVAAIINWLLGPPANYIFLHTIMHPNLMIYYSDTVSFFYHNLIGTISINDILTGYQNKVGILIYLATFTLLMIIIHQICYLLRKKIMRK